MSETSAKSQPVRGLAKSVAADIGTRTNATIAGLLALAGVTGLAGGFEEAAPEEVVSAAELAQPEELEVVPLTVQVQRTYVLDGARVVHMRLSPAVTFQVLVLVSVMERVTGSGSSL